MTDTALVLDYRSPGGRRPRRKPTVGEELFKLCVLATLFVGYGLAGDREKPVDTFFIAGVLLWLVVALVAIKRKGRRRRGNFTFDDRGWACLLMLLVTLGSFAFSLGQTHVCPHGKRWANNQIGVARSVNGGPCRNGPRFPGSKVWHVGGPWYVFIPRRY